jgi:hypothetical protein
MEPFESYLEAAIIFGRVAIHRLKTAADQKAQSNPSLKNNVKEWWDSLRGHPAIDFFRAERDFISKVGPPKVGQILYGPRGDWPQKAEAYYYFEDPKIPATKTVERHLDSVEKIVADAEGRFGTLTLLGRWW